MPSETALNLIAVDIGNSRIKLGRFRSDNRGRPQELPEPSATFELPILDRSGDFDFDRFAGWSALGEIAELQWLVASVHRGAADRLLAATTQLAGRLGASWELKRITYRDLSLPIHLEEPEKVGIDRLLAALAADRLRQPDRAAVVVDLGTAMTIDLVKPDGAFAGGAILPGIAMSARAFAENTDALPCVPVESLDREVHPVGKSTVEAIQSGLFWGTLGAIRELIRQYSQQESLPPDVFLTGGAAAHMAGLLAAEMGGPGPDRDLIRVCHLPNLVLSGIALVHQATAVR